MDWYSVKASGNEEQILQTVVSELYDVEKVLQSFRHVYTQEQKSMFGFNHDAVSYHAGQTNNKQVTALIILERHYEDGIVYKPYSEHDCPGQFWCPRSILNKLSPTQDMHAMEWRRRAERTNRIIEIGSDTSDFKEFVGKSENIDRGLTL